VEAIIFLLVKMSLSEKLEDIATLFKYMNTLFAAFNQIKGVFSSMSFRLILLLYSCSLGHNAKYTVPATCYTYFRYHCIVWNILLYLMGLIKYASNEPFLLLRIPRVFILKYLNVVENQHVILISIK